MSDLVIHVSPVGPELGNIQAFAGALMTQLLGHGLADTATVSASPEKVSPRLMSFRLLPHEDKSTGVALSNRYVAVFYDYGNDRSIMVQGDLGDNEPANVTESVYQLLPDWEEYQLAVKILRGNTDLGDALASGALRSYRPMPPLGQASLPSGRIERTLMVGLLPAKGQTSRHKIVGVNIAKGTVLRFERGAPDGATASDHVCGPPGADQPTVSRFTPGQYEVVVTQAGTELWRFTAVRPAASSGTNGSGIELVSVKYRGKLVLGRAHAPILNVLYDPGDHGCGPAYRDWQWEESMIQAEGKTWLRASANARIRRERFSSPVRIKVITSEQPFITRVRKLFL